MQREREIEKSNERQKYKEEKGGDNLLLIGGEESEKEDEARSSSSIIEVLGDGQIDIVMYRSKEDTNNDRNCEEIVNINSDRDVQPDPNEEEKNADDFVMSVQTSFQNAQELKKCEKQKGKKKSKKKECCKTGNPFSINQRKKKSKKPTRRASTMERASKYSLASSNCNVRHGIL